MMMMVVLMVLSLDYYVDSSTKEISVSMFVCVDYWTGWLVALTCLKLNSLRRDTARNQDPGGWEGEGHYIHYHHQNGSYIKMGSDERHFLCFIDCEGQGHKTVHKPQLF